MHDGWTTSAWVARAWLTMPVSSLELELGEMGPADAFDDEGYTLNE